MSSPHQAGAPSGAGSNEALITAAIHYLVAHADEQPELSALAARLGRSPSHLQRIFQRRVGVSPKRFVQFLTVEHAKGLLAASSSVLDTSFEVGLSGPGRLHDHFVALLAMTPGEYKQGGAGIHIHYGEASGPLGPMWLAWTPRGLCRLAFTSSDAPQASPKDCLEALRVQWPKARLTQDAAGARREASRIATAPQAEASPLAVLVKGTNFQVQVWRALLAIPPGAVSSYSRLATALGRPKAARAVGQAVGKNPVAWLIPCHRVLRESGALGGYRWGLPTKRALLAWESAQSSRG